MPELPEVETVKETLKRNVLNRVITDVKIFYPNIIETPTSDQFKKEIIGQRINDIKRRGKWLMFELDNYYLLSHLRMEGRYFIRDLGDEKNKHEHIAFILDNNSELRYLDTRKFGRMHLIEKGKENETKPLNELGLEPWDKELTINYLKDKYKNKKLPIKTVILDQNIVVGVGNIYADEILFLSKINPFTKSSELTDENLKNIIRHTKEVLDKAIKEGGTTIRTYESSEGVHGKFQNSLLVHGREKEKCPTCKNIILKTRIGGRGTYYCPDCQK